MDPVPAIRIASLVLASEALWWLGHFEDARKAAQAAADADPASAQALWRLAVALYRQGRFEETGERLDNLLRLADRFAPAWALRPGQGLARSRQSWCGADRLRRRGGADLRFRHVGGAVPDGAC
jgi:tetratricopeptide (TPR) repeat protein